MDAVTPQQKLIQEYSNVCCQIGDRHYKIAAMQKEIASLSASADTLIVQIKALTPPQDVPRGTPPAN